jgi:hypothetical protein
MGGRNVRGARFITVTAIMTTLANFSSIYTSTCQNQILPKKILNREIQKQKKIWSGLISESLQMKQVDS